MQGFVADIDHNTVDAGKHVRYVAINDIDTRYSFYLIKTMLIKVDTADHFVSIGFTLQVAGPGVAEKIQVVPLPVNDLVKKSIFFFPETPGAVVCNPGRFIDQEYFLILEIA